MVLRTQIIALWVGAIAATCSLSGVAQALKDDLANSILTFNELVDNGERRAASSLAREIRLTPEFADLSELSRFDLMTEALFLEIQLENRAAAYELLDELMEINASSHQLVSLHATADYFFGDFVGASEQLILLAERQSSFAEILGPQNFEIILRNLWRQEDTEILINLLIATEGLFQVDSPLWTDADRRFLLVRAYLRQGNLPMAVQNLRKIRKPRLLARIQYDREFEALWRDENSIQAISVREATERELERLETATTGGTLDAGIEFGRIEALFSIGRLGEATNRAEATVAALNAGTEYADATEYRWKIEDALAMLLAHQGRFAEAENVLRIALERSQLGSIEFLNLATRLAGDLYSRSEDQAARELIASVRPYVSNDFRRSYILAIEACLEATAGNITEYESLLSVLRNLENGRRWAIRRALVCGEREDEIAASLVEELSAELTRDGALRDAQRFSANGSFETPRANAEARDIEYFYFYRRVYARPDVQRAILRVGRQMDFRVSYLVFSG